MEKKLSEMNHAELMKFRIKTATGFALGMTIFNIFSISQTAKNRLFAIIISAIFG